MLFTAGTLASILAVAPSVMAVPGARWYKRQADAQTSFTLDPAVISPGLANNGQEPPVAGQVASLTTTNNFINFCVDALNQGVELTDGQQKVAGSCNPTPIGRVAAFNNAPRCKFVFPPNGDVSLQPNTPFTVIMKIANLDTGNFVNPNTNYYAAPQQVNGGGDIIGHSHVVIEPIPALDSKEPLDPFNFAFFKGLNGEAQNGELTADVTKGLPAGAFRMCSINTAANHQPVLISNAQHGSLDDCVYFTVGAPPGTPDAANGAGADPNAQAGDANADPNAQAGANADPNAQAGANADPNAQAGANADPNAQAGANADPNAQAGANDQGNAAGADPNAQGNANANADPNAAADPNAQGNGGNNQGNDQGNNNNNGNNNGNQGNDQANNQGNNQGNDQGNNNGQGNDQGNNNQGNDQANNNQGNDQANNQGNNNGQGDANGATPPDAAAADPNAAQAPPA
jgi:hypothetical protein